MNNSPLTFGTEAEFLKLDSNGHICELSGSVLQPCDIVGTDGHAATNEIRTAPSNGAIDQFSKIGRCFDKYFIALNCYGKPEMLQGTLIRGGAYFFTPLSIHIHFGNFENTQNLDITIEALSKLLNYGFLKHVITNTEWQDRRGAGYGLDGPNAFRIKGKGWWEWRQPFSCLTPHHLLSLLTSAEIIGRFGHDTPKILKPYLKKNQQNNEEKLLELLINHGPSVVEYNCGQIAKLIHDLLHLGPFDWDTDLSIFWMKGKTYV